MIFYNQLSKLRKQANMTQEDLAEKCDVSRQAVAKWENGESVPDIYKISQIAHIFEVSLEELIWGDNREKTQKEVVRKIYGLFAENIENLRTSFMVDSWGSDKDLATKLRAEIKRSRLVLPKKDVEQLLDLAMDFGRYYGYVICDEKYKDVFYEIIHTDDRKKYYCNKIIPQMYESLERVIGGYIDLP